MKPLLALLIVLAIFAAVALLTWYLLHRATQLRLLRREAAITNRALDEIQAATDLYLDIDHILATQIRAILRQRTTDRIGLHQ